MADLTPLPFPRLASRMLRELEAKDAIFDLPRRSFYLGDPAKDFSVEIHGRSISAPLGPAAGPHTQLAHNIVLAWLAGARVFELKTVQILDRLRIPRPCIDMRNVGYNVEWSQELALEQSLEEYVKASMLIDILRARRIGLVPGYDRSLFDMSVGYDLAGVKSPRLRAFIDGMKDASHTVERLRRQLPPELSRWRDLDFRTSISSTVTLSTFHGCPPGEIEAMAEHLMAELGLDVVIKLNPTLLGAEETRLLLNGVLGYDDIRIPPEAFEKDARWDQVVAFVGRLLDRSDRLGCGFGVKFSNTLVVENPGDFLPASEKTRYLSGAPLHALAMHLVRRFRRRFGDRVPISFSAGVDRANFPDAVSLGLAPVTACSDLLKPGGYARLKSYLEELSKRMEAVGASDIASFIVRARGEKAESPSDARVRNTESYVAAATRDPRYARAANIQTPKKLGGRLTLFDCLTCDKCLSVCPNGANFTYEPAAEVPQVSLVRDGAGWRRAAQGALALRRRHQLANFADFCNECGNCDLFCPEDGGPFRAKPRFHSTVEGWKASASDGFCVLREGAVETVWGRIDGKELVLAVRGGVAECRGPGVDVRFPLAEPEGPAEGSAAGEVDLTPFLLMNSIRRAVLSPETVNYVNS